MEHTWEEFELLTNGLRNDVAERFCKLYRILENVERGVTLPALQRQLDASRNSIGYLLGAKGFPPTGVNLYFQVDSSALWKLSKTGESVSSHVRLLEERLSEPDGRTRAVSRTPSIARVEVFEKSYEEAKEELTKNLEWLSFDDPSKFIQHIRNLIKQSPKVEQYFADEMETWVITPEEEIYDEKTLKRAVVHAMKEFIFLSGQLDAYRAGKLKLGRAPVEI